MLSWWYYAVCCIVAWVAACVFHRYGRSGGYGWLSVMMFFAAVTSFSLGRVYEGLPGKGAVVAEVVVRDEPVRSGKWLRATVSVASVRDGSGGWVASGFDAHLFADTALVFASGNRLIVSGSFYPYESSAGSYEALMLRRGVGGRLFVFVDGIVAADTASRPLAWWDRLHNVAVRKFAKLDGGKLTGVAAAMTTGDKRFIPKDLRQAYSASGGAHLLAVSGLHVGIVFVLVNLLLYYLPFVRKGHIIKNLLSVAAVWLFACAAGLTPSVVRAAIMFAFLQFALSRGNTGSSLNALAASAIVTLALRPGYIADPGFVMSYAAVLSILLFYKPVFLLVRTRRKWLDRVISIYVVGLVASLAVAPFVSYWFGTVPTAGLIINPLVILSAHVIVFGGVLWLLWPFGFGAGVFEWLLGVAESFQNGVIRWCSGLRWGVVEVRLSLFEAIAAFVLLMVAAVYLGKLVEKRGKKLSLLSQFNRN